MSVSNCQFCVAKERCGLYRIHRETQGAATLTERLLAPGDAVFTQGEQASHLQAVKVGALLLRRDASLGDRRAVAVVGQGVLLGMSAMLNRVASADAQAYMPTRICELDMAPALHQMARNPQLGFELSKAVMRLSDILLQWSSVARLPDVGQRLSAVLRLLTVVHGSQVVEVPSRDDLAQLCGCAPETVSRALGRLARSGQVVKHQRGRVEWCS